MGFNLVKCPNGHYFDSSQFKVCPQCGAAVTKKQTVSNIDHTQPVIGLNLGGKGGNSPETSDMRETSDMLSETGSADVENPFKNKLLSNSEKAAPKSDMSASADTTILKGTREGLQSDQMRPSAPTAPPPPRQFAPEPQPQNYPSAAVPQEPVGTVHHWPPEQPAEPVPQEPVGTVHRWPPEQPAEEVLPEPVDPMDQWQHAPHVDNVSPQREAPVEPRWNAPQQTSPYAENRPVQGMPSEQSRIIPQQTSPYSESRPAQGMPSDQARNIPPQGSTYMENRPGVGASAYQGRNASPQAQPYDRSVSDPNDPYYRNTSMRDERVYADDPYRNGGYPNYPSHNSSYNPQYNSPLPYAPQTPGRDRGGVYGGDPAASNLEDALPRIAKTQIMNGRNPGFVRNPGRPSDDDGEVTVALERFEPDRVLPAGFLIVLNGDNMGKVLTLYAGENRIGRNGKGNKFEIDLSFNNKVHRSLQATIIYNAQNRRTSIMPNMESAEKLNKLTVNGAPLDRHIILRNYSRIMVESTVMMFVAVCGDAFNWENM